VQTLWGLTEWCLHFLVSPLFVMSFVGFFMDCDIVDLRCHMV
jgi:hypothetical protein